MHLREYHPDDLAEVVQLFCQAVRQVNCRDYTSEQIAAWSPDPPDLHAWAQRLAQRLVLICENEGKIVGFLRADRQREDAAAKAGLIDLLYVHPQHQRQGVATLLMTDALRRLAQQGIFRVWAHVSITAEPFFERQGFRAVQRQTVARRGVNLENCLMLRSATADG